MGGVGVAVTRSRLLDVPAMAAAIGQLASNLSLRQQFSGASQLFVRQKFAPAHTYRRLAECYHRVLGTAQAAR